MTPRWEHVRTIARREFVATVRRRAKGNGRGGRHPTIEHTA